MVTLNNNVNHQQYQQLIKKTIQIQTIKLFYIVNISNIKYPLIQNGNLFYQEVYNNDTIIRAYTNVFFWHMNTFAIDSIRNLGYYSVLQNQILSRKYQDATV